MATIYDVAERAAVSPGTVSRVINNHPSVRTATRRAVLAAIDELQYQPNPIARTLRTSRTRTLGLVFSDMQSSPTVPERIAAAELIAQERGYALLIADCRYDPDIEASNIRTLLERRVDGLLCQAVKSTRDVQALVQPSGVPLVVFSRIVPNPDLHGVVFEERDAIAAAADHLVTLGHTAVGFVYRDRPLIRRPNWRVHAVHEALRSRGAGAGGEFDRAILTRDACTAAVSDLLGGISRPTALIVGNQYLIPPTLRGIRQAGLRVPDDVSLVCFGDSDWAQVIEPPLNVIAYDESAHLEAATRLLLGLVEGERDLPRTITQATHYIQRGSVARPGARRC